jgi:hypothetical protein
MSGHRKFCELAAELDANPDYPQIAERLAAELAAEDAAREGRGVGLPGARVTTNEAALETTGLGR